MLTLHKSVMQYCKLCVLDAVSALLEHSSQSVHDGQLRHRLSSYTQTSCLAEPSIRSLIGSLEAEGQLEGREEKEG